MMVDEKPLEETVIEKIRLDLVQWVHYEKASISYLILSFDGAVFSQEWKDALWGRFSMDAPRRRRRSVERYSIVKRA